MKTSQTPFQRKTVNDKYIEILQIGWCVSNIILRFRSVHNRQTTFLLEDHNLIYLLDMHEIDLIKNKIQYTNTATVVWLGGPIPEQATLEAIEQTLLESKEFEKYDINQVELITKNIILHPEEQARGGKVKNVHAIVPDDRKSTDTERSGKNLP